MPVLNMKGLKESDGEIFKTIPAGQYPARISKIEQKTSERTGNDYFNFAATILAGEEHEGQNLFFMQMIPVEGTEHFQRHVDGWKRLYIACGLDVNDDSVDTDDLMGAELRLVVNEEPAKDKEGKVIEGKMRNTVTDVLPV